MRARASNPAPPPPPLPKTPEDPEKGRVPPVTEPGKSEHPTQSVASGRLRVLASGFAMPGPHGARDRGGGQQHRRAPKFEEILILLGAARSGLA